MTPKTIYVVQALYSCSEDGVGRAVPEVEDRCIVVASFENPEDAHTIAEERIRSGGWGQIKENGWTDEGWLIWVDSILLYPKAKSKPKKTAANPSYGRGETALYTGLTSLGGALVGGFFGPMLRVAGSVLGGVYGGSRFAPTGREKGARAGGGIGGLLGPVGAGLGSLIGTRMTDRTREARRAMIEKNPRLYPLAELGEEDRNYLYDMVCEGQKAHVQSVLAESRGERAKAAKLRKKAEWANELIVQFEREHGLEESDRVPERLGQKRRKKRRATRGAARSVLKGKLMR